MAKKYYAKALKVKAKKKELPDWYLIFRAGSTKLEDGPEYVVDEDAYHEVIAHFRRRGLDPVFDYEHQTLNGTEAPAAGWIKEWRWSEEGIFARVEWTKKAMEMLANKEYRYYSPVFEIKERSEGEYALAKVHNVGLTNDPRTNNIKPLIAKRDEDQEERVDFLAKLIGILGLKEDATEEDVVMAVKKMASDPKEKQEDSSSVSAKNLTATLGLDVDSTEEVIIANIQGLKTSAQNGSELGNKVEELEKELAELRAERLIAKNTDRLSPHMLQNMGEGQDFHYLVVLAKSDPKAFEATVKTFAKVLPDSLPKKNNNESGGEGELTETQKFVAKKMGLTENQFLGKK